MKKQRDLNIIKSAGKELNLGTRTIVSKKVYNRKKKYQVSYCRNKGTTIRVLSK